MPFVLSRWCYEQPCRFRSAESQAPADCSNQQRGACEADLPVTRRLARKATAAYTCMSASWIDGEKQGGEMMGHQLL